MATESAIAVRTLDRPTGEQAEHILRELDFEDRAAGVLMKASGTSAMTIYSLEHVISFFGKDNTEFTVQEGAKFAGRNVDVAYIEPSRLARWIGEAVGDPELADAIESEIAKIDESRGYPPRMRVMRELVSQRILQCFEVLGLSETGEEIVAELEQGEEQ